MSYDTFRILEFRPLWLTLEDIGPFRDKPFQMKFTNRDDEPVNMYMLLSENGRGKTTILELMVCLMSLLDKENLHSFEFEDLDNGQGRVQWDFLLRFKRYSREETRVFSLVVVHSGHPWLNPWKEAELQKYHATAWNAFGFRRHSSGRLEEMIGNDFVEDLLAAVRGHIGTSHGDFEGSPLSWPTLLYFSAYRDIPRVTQGARGIMEPQTWGYQPVHRFDRESEGWLDSLDNLLVWLKWLDDGRFEQAIQVINQRIFHGSEKFLKGVRKEPPQAEIMNGPYRHRLDRLSSGEKSLVQLYLRTGIHMTQNTLLLVDEIDVHLHSKQQHNLLNTLKQLAKDNPGLTVIFSTHARELIPAYAFEIPEPGLRKSGHLIEESL